MTLRVLGSVKNEPEDGRWQLRAADAARLRERGFGRRGDLPKGILHYLAPAGQQLIHGGTRLARVVFGALGLQLRLGQALPAGVREQPVGAAGQMRQMKADRRRPAGAPPELLGAQAVRGRLDILQRHHERMGWGLKQPRNTRKRTAQPRLGHHIEMKKYLVRPGQRVVLDASDPDDTHLVHDKEQAAKRFSSLQSRLPELQEKLFAGHDRKVLIVLQGMDTSGKDGAIRHVGGCFNPQGTRVVSFRQPTGEELDHDFLWRVHRQVPGNGEVTLFNRSHYEDVLIVRVRKLVPKDVWKQRYEQINAFERILSDTGTLVLKCFLHISKREQRERLQRRVEDPTKCWKFKEGDLKERKLWKDYQQAYEDALSKTSTSWAPWHIVPANHKWYRDYVIASIVVDALEGLHLKYPKCDVSGIVVK